MKTLHHLINIWILYFAFFNYNTHGTADFIEYEVVFGDSGHHESLYEYHDEAYDLFDMSSTQEQTESTGIASTVTQAPTGNADTTTQGEDRTSQASETVTSPTAESVTSQSTEAVTSPTTEDQSTEVPVCSKNGFFGKDCVFRCHCLNPSEACDKVSGTCTSGCLSGWYGPGCLSEERPGTLSIVVALAVLFTMTLCMCIFQSAYFFILLPRKTLTNNSSSDPRRGVGGPVDNMGFEFTDLASASNASYQALDE